MGCGGVALAVVMHNIADFVLVFLAMGLLKRLQELRVQRLLWHEIIVYIFC